MLPRLRSTYAARASILRRIPSHLTCVHQSPKRLFSALVDSPRREQVSIPCRSNGFITLDIFHPLTCSPPSPILIYLPSGPIIPDQSDEEERIISSLSASTRSTIARINYRLSPQHQFPTPIHDVLTGYEWILENLIHDGSNSTFRQPHISRLGVCGELVGGSLATMLALTECRLGGSRIGAAAVNNPIVDWVFPDELPPLEQSEHPEPFAPEDTSFPADQDLTSWWTQQDEQDARSQQAQRKRTPRPPPPTSWVYNGANPIIPSLTLSGERDVLFSKPENYCDRFASPIHFFRSPHGQLIYPKGNNILASTPPKELPEDSFDIETQLSINHYESLGKALAEPEIPTLVRCRAYVRIYPPSGIKLELPQLHITTGSRSPLFDQASELAKLMKRSIARQALRSRSARTKWQDPTEKARYEEYAEQRVRMSMVDGVGLWTQPEDTDIWKTSMASVGAWMREILVSAT
ncbi:alpha/beta-hydrolase [Zopfia rhizophila CBS 207.26]|uniref:Alpha/beta-hydrolase n=1 Tax=Zopfia rhizophila CBS 207.26 TaxID=1314779 RepID=A0A6A6EQK4_9PEZI|nr:alpha/beta-hydrolase [Zopfia rhizophila CBS 207.26]